MLIKWILNLVKKFRRPVLSLDAGRLQDGMPVKALQFVSVDQMVGIFFSFCNANLMNIGGGRY